MTELLGRGHSERRATVYTPMDKSSDLAGNNKKCEFLDHQISTSRSQP
jgi:hypothetical protein